MFVLRDRLADIEISFTDRHGGSSEGAFSSLNLGSSGGDDDASVEQNLDLVSQAFAGVAAPLVRMHQVHGSDVAVADGGTGQILECDGVVTTTAGLVLMVRVADCVPVLLADPVHGVVGAAHAGRRGMVGGVVPATIKRMRDLGAERIFAWVGPRVCGDCYEVPADMRDGVAAQVPESYAETSWQTPSLDLGAGVGAQLTASGIEDVTDVSLCTMEDENLFSYRRQGASSGRLAGLVWIRP